MEKSRMQDHHALLIKELCKEMGEPEEQISFMILEVGVMAMIVRITLKIINMKKRYQFYTRHSKPSIYNNHNFIFVIIPTFEVEFFGSKGKRSKHSYCYSFIWGLWKFCFQINYYGYAYDED